MPGKQVHNLLTWTGVLSELTATEVGVIVTLERLGL